MDSYPIWHPAGPRTAVLRRRLRLEADAVSGWLRCAAAGPFHLFVDGERVATGGVEPAPLWVQVDLGPYPAGEHEVMVRAAGPAGAWVRCEGRWLDRAGAAMAEVVSDASWSAGAAPAMSPPDRAGTWEGVSARLDPARRGDGDGEWVPVAALEPGGAPVEPHPEAVVEERVEAGTMAAWGEVAFDSGPGLEFAVSPDAMTTCKCVHGEGMLREGRVAARIQTTRTDRAVYAVLDLGRQVSGWPSLRLRGGAGGVIDLGFCATWGRIDGRARYVCTSGRQEWFGLEPRTSRYVVLRFQGFGELCELEHVSLLTRRVEAAHQGRLSSSGRLGRVWQVGGASLAACRRETYHSLTRSSPDWLRYRALALNDYYLTGHTAAARTTLATSPVQLSGEAELAGLAAYPLFLEEYLLHSGDRELVTERLEDGLRLAAAMEAARGSDGLVASSGGSLPSAALTALCAGSLNALARVGQAVGQRRRTGACRDAAAALRKALMPLRSEERGLYADEAGGQGFSQLTSALMLLFGLERPDRRLQVAAALGGEGVTPVANLVEAFCLVGGLWEAGAAAAALDAVGAHWTRIADRDGLTWQDKTVRPAPQAVPGPEYYLGARLVGLRPLEPGYERVEVRPPLAGPRRAGGAFATARGWMEVRWQRPEEGSGFYANVELERAGPTHVAVPRVGQGQPTITVNGETVWRNEKVYPNGMVHEIASEAEYVVLVLEGAGAFAVTAE